MHTLRRAVIGTLLIIAAPLVEAQTYPSKPVRLIVPCPAAGDVDAVSRLLAGKLGGTLGLPVIVEKRAGAAGTMRADQMAKSAPDGYAPAKITASSHALAPSVLKTLPYDPLADFTPVSLTASTRTSSRLARRCRHAS